MTITRAQFLNAAKNGIKITPEVERALGNLGASGAALARAADVNRNQLIVGTDELNKAFDFLDFFDSNGDFNSVDASVALKAAFDALLKTASPVASTPQHAALKNTRFAGEPQLTQVLAGETLKNKSSGEGVRKVQQTMIDMGFAYPGSADGVFGAQSAKAIRNFQTNASKMFADVKVTGTVDSATLRALDELAPAAGSFGQTKNIPVPFYDGKPVRVVVLRDEHRTFLFDAQGKVKNIFMNAVGAKNTPTHDGYKIVKTKMDERAATAAGIELWGGPVFGARILDLSWATGASSGEELHGTQAPNQLGEDVSHGCVRHSNADIVNMYNSLLEGDRVAIASGLGDAHLVR
jgi:lipoprotein-anchoring transpeptidase ErfK/SrfK